MRNQENLPVPLSSLQNIHDEIAQSADLKEKMITNVLLTIFSCIHQSNKTSFHQLNQLID